MVNESSKEVTIIHSYDIWLLSFILQYLDQIEYWHAHFERVPPTGVREKIGCDMPTSINLRNTPLCYSRRNFLKSKSLFRTFWIPCLQKLKKEKMKLSYPVSLVWHINLRVDNNMTLSVHADAGFHFFGYMFSKKFLARSRRVGLRTSKSGCGIMGVIIGGPTGLT